MAGARSVLVVDGHRLVIAVRRGARTEVREVELRTPGGQPLPVAAIATGAAVRLLRDALRPTRGTQLLGFALPGVEAAGELLYVPRAAEASMSTIAAVLVGADAGEGNAAYCWTSHRVGETALSGIHRLLLFPGSALEPVARALRAALGRDLPYLDLRFGLRSPGDDEPYAAVAWAQPGANRSLVVATAGGPPAHAAWFAGEGIEEHAVELIAELHAELQPLDAPKASAGIAVDDAGGLDAPLHHLALAPSGWEALLGGLLDADLAGQLPRVDAAGASGARLGLVRERARRRLAGATAVALVLSILGAFASRAMLGQTAQALRERQEAELRGRLELEAGAELVGELEARRERVARRIAAAPAATLLAAVSQLDPDLLVLGVALEHGRREAPLLDARYAGKLRARFRNAPPADQLAERVARVVAALDRTPGVTRCQLEVVPGKGDEELVIAFSLDAVATTEPTR